MRPRFATGGLDQDASFNSELGSGGPSAKRLRALQRKQELELNFEVDPNKKLRKGGKAGTNSFKSKKRFKRR